MKANRYHGIVYEVEDFLTIEERQMLLKFALNAKDKDWEAKGRYQNEKPLDIGKENLQFFYERIKPLFLNYEKSMASGGIQRFKPGMLMHPHIDNLEGKDSGTQFGVVSYINDDFIGGEINYPTLGLTIKPKAGSLICHPATLLHCVKEVLPGPIRYFLTDFIYGDSTTAVDANKLIVTDI